MNPFALVGLAIDLAGVAMIVAGVLAPAARLPLIAGGAALSLMGGTAFIVGLRAGRFSGTSPRLLARGAPAVATVEDARETGIVCQSSPVVHFRLKVTHEARDYPVEVRQAAPRGRLRTLVPGSRLAVKVDPGDPSRVAIDWSQEPLPPRSGTAPGPVTAPAGNPPVDLTSPERRASAAELLARGRRGTARVLAVREMGDAVRLGVIAPDDERAGARMALLDLEVKLPGRAPYPVRVVHWLPASLAGRVEPGREVVVAVDREDPEHAVAIDWETPPA